MKKTALILILSAGSYFCFSQTKDFKFRRKISTADSGGWYSLILQKEMFSHLNKDFSDLRIIQFNGKDTVESPYILKIHQQEITEETFHPSVLNKTKKEGSQFFTLELPKGAQINFLDLLFNETNFDGFVTIEGSNDQREWFEIERRQRIISIVNKNIEFHSGKIHFSLQSFRYLRVKVDADKILTLKEISAMKKTVKSPTLSKVESTFLRGIGKKSKQTVINIKTDYYQPISKLVVAINEKVDYYRPFRLEKLSDSTNTPKGWQYFYETIVQGYFTSLDSNQFVFDYSLANKLRLIIDDADNTPLHIESITILSPAIELEARMPQGNHYLYYGNSRASSPSYDLVNFAKKIPVHLPGLILGNEEILKPEEAEASPLIKNKMWLWILMGLVIAVLGFFTMRMMREK